MAFEMLVEEYRGGILENIHPGMICAVSEERHVTNAVGDADHVTFLRSAAKPFQAIPAIKHGVDKHFNLTDRETSLFSASHRGEAFHIDSLLEIARKTGVDEDQLLCLPTYPLNEQAKAKCWEDHLPKRKIYHNCSGKHLGMLGTAKLLDEELDGYWKADHPVQQRILGAVSEMSEWPKEEIGKGVDGCGVPVFALPLKQIAVAYLKLACPDLIEDSDTRQAVERIGKVMNANPEMIAGTNFICSVLLEDDNIVAKGGAQGVYGFGLKKERIAFALKVMDGSETVWPVIVASILEQIGYSNEATIERLRALLPKDMKNDNDKIVGEYRSVFKLK